MVSKRYKKSGLAGEFRDIGIELEGFLFLISFSLCPLPPRKCDLTACQLLKTWSVIQFYSGFAYNDFLVLFNARGPALRIVSETVKCSNIFLSDKRKNIYSMENALALLWQISVVTE